MTGFDTVEIPIKYPSILINMDDQIQTLKSIRGAQNDSWSGRMLSGATLTVPKVGPGFLHSIFVGSASAPTLTIFDQASGSSGTILVQMNQSPAVGGYVVDVPFTNGLSAIFQLTAGSQPTVTLSYK